MSALFANMVVQQTNLALMMLGQVPDPQSGELVRDLEAARMFIDQLETLEFKTKGNLDKHEQKLLQQSLTTLRLAFVDALENQPSAPSAARPPAPAGQAAEPAKASATDNAASQPLAEQDPKKKFTKKY
jgi:hypothetical protein